jgi:hypothetical protein
MIYDAIACGILAAATWAGLVWMSAERPVSERKSWWLGVCFIAIANGLLWLALSGLQLKLIPLWGVAFFAMGAIMGRVILPLYADIRIPFLWSVILHPTVIAVMVVLLGGALGVF